MADKALRVVLIAPQVHGADPIPWAQNELPGLMEIDGLDLVTVPEQNATMTNISRALRQHTDIVVWAGHGDRDQLLITGRGEKPAIIDGSWLATQMNSCAPPYAAVIAACNSELDSDSLESITGSISDSGINAIGMISTIKNSPASTYTIEFCRAMVAWPDVRNAHLVAKEAAARVDREQAKLIKFVPAYTGSSTRSLIDRMDGFDVRLQEISADVQFLVKRFSRNGEKP